MNEDRRRALVRDAVRRRLATYSVPPDAPSSHEDAPAVSIGHHASHDVYLTLVNVGDACLIEPSVTCSHCNYCKSHGHQVDSSPNSRVIVAVLRRLRRAIRGMDELAVEKISEDSLEDPFRVLIATMLSAQTRDEVTHAAATRLFRVARTPRTMARLTTGRIQTLIYPVSFYRIKAAHVKEACVEILQRFNGRVPDRMGDLLTLPGVGRKTANLVLILSHASRENICVDTHVHRISNRLAWVRTKTPDQTEQALYRVVPRRWWPDVNLLLVTWGQNICRPLYPRCRACVVRPLCPRIGVTKESRLT